MSDHVGYALGALLGGLVFIGIGFYVYRRGQLLRDTPISEVASMAVGTVELTGRAAAGPEALTAPLTGEDAVLVSYGVREYERGADLEKEWATVETGLAAVPFYLDDGTGRVLVDVPDGVGDRPVTEATEYDLSFETMADEEFEGGGSQPASVTRFLEEHTDVEPAPDRERKYVQQTIPVGEELLVFGDAELADRVDVGFEPESDLVVTRDADTELFLVSDKSEAELTRSLVAAPILVVLGVLLTVGGLWWTLSIVGI